MAFRFSFSAYHWQIWLTVLQGLDRMRIDHQSLLSCIDESPGKFGYDCVTAFRYLIITMKFLPKCLWSVWKWLRLRNSVKHARLFNKPSPFEWASLYSKSLPSSSRYESIGHIPCHVDTGKGKSVSFFCSSISVICIRFDNSQLGGFQ
jgi:hypothetical protein